jgi:hypothetical protein
MYPFSEFSLHGNKIQKSNIIFINFSCSRWFICPAHLILFDYITVIELGVKEML